MNVLGHSNGVSHKYFVGLSKNTGKLELESELENREIGEPIPVSVGKNQKSGTPVPVLIFGTQL
jgi:hypothetical protein